MRTTHWLVVSLLVTTAALPKSAGASDAAPPEIERLLFQSLSVEGVSAEWLADKGNPADASEAIGIVYSESTTGGNATDMDVGYFRRSGSRFKLQGRVKNLFGVNARDVMFLPQRIELTTTVPEPGDARCCATGAARWSIDRRTLEAKQLR